MTIDNMKVGGAIAALRQARGLTQQQLAATLNVSHQAVSKWENGQALPDVQTLTGLSTLFGVTMEQLLAGEIPTDRLRGEKAAPEPAKDLGTCIKGVFDGIGELFQPPKAQEAPEAEIDEDDGTQSAEVKQEEGGEDGALDVEKLIQTAPFMTRTAIEDMLNGYSGRLAPGEIARLAPFVGADCLEGLIVRSEAVVNWELLRRIAPFLKREAVDRLAKAAAKGERYARPAVNDLAKAFDEFGRAVGKNVDTAVRSVVKFGEGVVNDIANTFSDAGRGPQDAPAPVSRSPQAEQVRKMVFEKALADGKWDWLAEHMGEVTDEALIRKIAAKACAEGRQDWVLEHVKGYFGNAELVLAALNAGNWDWLTSAVMSADGAVQRTVAQAAAEQGRWDWLEKNCATLDIDEIALPLAQQAYEAGAAETVMALVVNNMEQPEVDTLAAKALEARDMDMLGALCPYAGNEFLCGSCLTLAAADDWEGVYALCEFADQDTIGRLTEIAVSKGNWQAIDELDNYLD